MRKLIPISEAAKLLGVHADTLHRWEREGKIKPRRTSGNLRRYDIADIRPDLIHAAPTALRAARRRHHRRSLWRPEAGRRAERREARACRRSYSGGVVVARGACRRAADECGEQRDGREVWTFSWRPPSEESWSGREAPSFGNSELQTHNADRQLAGIRSWMKAPRASAFVCRNQANAFFTFLKRPLDGHGLDRESAKTG
jgi:excisionase family DNA binding protein